MPDMKAVGLSDVLDQLATLLESSQFSQAEGLLWPALDQYPDNPALWHYAACLMHATGRSAPACEMWLKSMALEPNPNLWANVGAALRAIRQNEEAVRALELGLQSKPEDVGLLTNLTACYVNEGDPWKGIEYGERAAAIGTEKKALFNLALCHLEAGNYARGFDLYAQGDHQHRYRKVYGTTPNLDPELHERLKGQGKTLIVHGEQGIGDELMFGTMLKDVSRDYRIVLDGHPRLGWLHEHSNWYSPLAKVYRTRKVTSEWMDKTGADAKVAIGDLARLYRRESKDFTWTGPVYWAPESERQQMRAHLEALADGRKIVGLATRGGYLSTNRHYRSMDLSVLRPLLERDDILWVGLDYEDVSDLAKGLKHYLWFPSVTFHFDYEHTAALLAATDAVVTVCQSVAHLSAAMGHRTLVLTPSRPAWRYGVKGDRWVWYPGEHAQLYRQDGNDWAPAVAAVGAAL